MRKILMTSFMCLSFLGTSALAIAQDGDKKKEETKKEKKECKDDSCKKPVK